MTNNKIYCLFFLILGILSGCVFQHGTSRDVVQGWDKGILWYHMYLKNDHSTAYCFDNPEFIKIFDESQQKQREIIVTYDTYLIKGYFCSTSQTFENVIVSNVKFTD